MPFLRCVFFTHAIVVTSSRTGIFSLLISCFSGKFHVVGVCLLLERTFFFNPQNRGVGEGGLVNVVSPYLTFVKRWSDLPPSYIFNIRLRKVSLEVRLGGVRWQLWVLPVMCVWQGVVAALSDDLCWPVELLCIRNGAVAPEIQQSLAESSWKSG